MSTPWQCAVCESLNQGGETCAACGARRTEATARPRPAPEPPARARPAPEPPARELPLQEEPGTEVPVRELPVRQPAGGSSYDDGYDLYDYFGIDDRADADDSYATSEGFEVRPRVRVYGCCLPICLGMLLAFLGATTVLANLVIRAL